MMLIRPCDAIVMALSAVVFSSVASASSPSYAEESELSIGRGFICNTKNELEAVITPDDGDIEASLAGVNSRFGKDSCTFATALFDKAADGGDVITRQCAVRVEKVELLGYLVGNELERVAEPKEQFFGTFESAGA
jgi:hypothetical protein